MTLEYIASALRNQPTIGRKTKSQKPKLNPDPNALTQAEIDGRRRKRYTLEDMKRIEAIMAERG